MKLLKKLSIGALAALVTFVAVGQTPTIFNLIRVNLGADIRGPIENQTGVIAINDDVTIDAGGGADEVTVTSGSVVIPTLSVTSCTGCVAGGGGAELSGNNVWTGTQAFNGTSFIVDAGGGTDELSITSGVFNLGAPLTVPNGGLGVGTVTGLLQGNGTSAVTAISNSSIVGQTLRVTGAAAYAWGALDLSNASAITGDLPDVNLTSNVPLIDADNVFTGFNTFDSLLAGDIETGYMAVANDSTADLLVMVTSDNPTDTAATFYSADGSTTAYTGIGPLSGGPYTVDDYTIGLAGGNFYVTPDNGVTETLTVSLGEVIVDGDLVVATVGEGIQIQEGSNAKMGSAVLVGGTVTVATTAVGATSRIFLTSNVDGGTPGYLRVSARNAGTDFTITSGSGSDTSTVAWVIFDDVP